MDNNEKIMNPLLEGLELYRKGQFTQAKIMWEQALAVAPHDVNVLHFLGMAHFNLGQLNEAIDWIDKALAINPEVAEIYNHRGSILQALQYFEAAISSHNRAIELNPQLAAAYTNRGNAFQQLQLLEAAIDSHTQAIVLQPDLIVAHNNRKAALNTLEKSIYHRADNAIVAYWKKQLGRTTKPRVGLIWNHYNDSRYSLADWIPHLPPELQYVCLQEEINAADQLTITFYPELFVSPDWNHPAGDREALCELMDLIISTDTRMAYFAAIIDKPLWLLLPSPDKSHGFDWKNYFLHRCLHRLHRLHHSIKLYENNALVITQIASDLERCNSLQ